MPKNPNEISVGGSIMVILILLTAELFKHAFISDERWYWSLCITIPAIAILYLFIRNRRIDIR